MRKQAILPSMAILAVVFLLYPRAGAQQPQPNPKALMNQYCIGCHNEKLRSGGLALDKLDFEHVADRAETWEKVARKLRAGMMPPNGARRPDPATYEAMVSGIEAELDRTGKTMLVPPGLHRLNRTEYTNVIRDLLALEVDASKFLPPDDSSHGFDNMAGTLQTSSALLEGYMSAAGKIAHLAVGDVNSPTQTMYPVPEDSSQNYHIEGLPFGTRGGMLFKHEFPADGEYAFKVTTVKRGNMGNGRAFGDIANEKLEVLIDGERKGIFEWDKQMARGQGMYEPGTIDLRFPVKAGLHTVGVTFLATNYAPINDHNQQFLRTTIETGGIPGFTFFPHVGSVRVMGPFNAKGAPDTETRKKIFVCKPAGPAQETACARQILAALARRAYRRPVTDQDTEVLMSFYQRGRNKGSFDTGIETALQRLLAEPEFLFRKEREPANVAAGKPFRITDLELASRLSFFLWSTIPDDELLALASENKLHEPKTLEQQVRRMLADARSEQMIVNFAGQWLNLRGLQSQVPVTLAFPDFDDNLRQAFRRETELFFDSIVHEDRGVLDLLTADYTFVNERLARHYGIPNIYGSQFRRIHLGPELDARRGLLGQGSVQTVSSQPGRTSPVMRGKWVFQTILGVPAPQPPPNVPPLPAKDQGTGGNSAAEPPIRQRMEQHRGMEPCRSCHNLMDPIGFVMENWDAVGTWRSKEGANPIDNVATLYDGTRMEGPVGLRNAMVKYSPQFLRNVTERLLTYALGRGAEYYDMPLVRQLVRDAARDNYRFSSLVLGIVKSDQFQMNMKEEKEERASAR